MITPMCELRSSDCTTLFPTRSGIVGVVGARRKESVSLLRCVRDTRVHELLLNTAPQEQLHLCPLLRSNQEPRVVLVPTTPRRLTPFAELQGVTALLLLRLSSLERFGRVVAEKYRSQQAPPRVLAIGGLCEAALPFYALLAELFP